MGAGWLCNSRGGGRVLPFHGRRVVAHAALGVVARLLLHVIAPVQMTLAWNESWERYPMLGPFVSWFWFGVIAVCTLPY
jgi:hypothetical protein